MARSLIHTGQRLPGASLRPGRLPGGLTRRVEADYGAGAAGHDGGQTHKADVRARRAPVARTGEPPRDPATGQPRGAEARLHIHGRSLLVLSGSLPLPVSSRTKGSNGCSDEVFHMRAQIGDNPESYIAGGNAAGFSTILCVTQWHNVGIAAHADAVPPAPQGPDGRVPRQGQPPHPPRHDGAVGRPCACLQRAIGHWPWSVSPYCESVLTRLHLPDPIYRLAFGGRSRRSSVRTLHCDALARTPFSRSIEGHRRSDCAAEMQHGSQATRTTGRPSWCYNDYALHCLATRTELRPLIRTCL